MHQPLHAGSRQDADGNTDAGGNKYQISLRTTVAPESRGAKSRAAGEPIGTNLHAVWDFFELGSAALSPENYAAKLRQEGIPRITPDALGNPAE